MSSEFVSDSSPAASVSAPAPDVDSEASPSGEEADGTADTKETVHVLKANKSTGIKSSYYHFSSTPAHEAERYKPQLITDPSQLAATVSPTPICLGAAPSNLTAPPSASTVAAAAPQAIGGSRWNAAGTWEDKDISQWAHAHFKKILMDTTAPSVNSKISGWEKVSGDCTIIFSRGKRKYGYDIAAIANFTAKHKEFDVKGTLEFPEIADSCADEPWQVLVAIKDQNAENKLAGEEVYDAWKKTIPEIRKKIDQWVADLKEHME